MAYEYGKAWRIHVGDGAGSEEFFALGGEGSFDWQRQSAEMDFSTKDDDVYGSAGYGLQTITFNVQGKLKLPDTALERIDTIAKSGNPVVNIKIMKGAVEKFVGAVAVGNFSSSFPHDGPATFSFTARNAAAPSVDALGASA